MAPRSREPTVVDRYITVCAQSGFSPRIEQENLQIHTMVELVAVGLGVALAPASLANLHRPGVIYRPLRNDGRITTGHRAGVAGGQRVDRDRGVRRDRPRDGTCGVTGREPTFVR
jgi:DNA-binding transcriptional LysR family regulator